MSNNNLSVRDLQGYFLQPQDLSSIFELNSTVADSLNQIDMATSRDKKNMFISLFDNETVPHGYKMFDLKSAQNKLGSSPISHFDVSIGRVFITADGRLADAKRTDYHGIVMEFISRVDVRQQPMIVVIYEDDIVPICLGADDHFDVVPDLKMVFDSKAAKWVTMVNPAVSQMGDPASHLFYAEKNELYPIDSTWRNVFDKVLEGFKDIGISYGATVTRHKVRTFILTQITGFQHAGKHIVPVSLLILSPGIPNITPNHVHCDRTVIVIDITNYDWFDRPGHSMIVRRSVHYDLNISMFKVMGAIDSNMDLFNLHDVLVGSIAS